MYKTIVYYLSYRKVSKNGKYYQSTLQPSGYWAKLESTQLRDLYVPNLILVNDKYGLSIGVHPKMPNLERLFSASGSDLQLHYENFKGTQYYPNIDGINSYEIVEREDGSKDAIANVSYYINPFTYYSDGQKDIVDPAIYRGYMNRWNENYNTSYDSINVYALGGYSTLTLFNDNY